jgi:hypothetical protein
VGVRERELKLPQVISSFLISDFVKLLSRSSIHAITLSTTSFVQKQHWVAPDNDRAFQHALHRRLLQHTTEAPVSLMQ